MSAIESLWERATDAAVGADRGLAAVRPLRLAVAIVGPRAGGKSALLNALLSDDLLETGEPEGPVAQVVRAQQDTAAKGLPGRWCQGEAVVAAKGSWFLPAETDLVEVRLEANDNWDEIAEWLPESRAVVYVTPPASAADRLLSLVTAMLDTATPLICVISNCDTVSPDEARRVMGFLRNLLPSPWCARSPICASLESQHAKLDVRPLEDELRLHAADSGNRRRAILAQTRRVLERANRAVAGDLEQMERKIAEAQKQCAEGEEELKQSNDEFAALADEGRRVRIGISGRFSARMAQAMAGTRSSIEAAVSAPGASLTGHDLRDLISDGVKDAWIGATTEAAEEFDEFVRVCRKRVSALAAENVVFSPPFGAAWVEPDLRPADQETRGPRATRLASGGAKAAAKVLAVNPLRGLPGVIGKLLAALLDSLPPAAAPAPPQPTQEQLLATASECLQSLHHQTCEEFCRLCGQSFDQSQSAMDEARAHHTRGVESMLAGARSSLAALDHTLGPAVRDLRAKSDELQALMHELEAMEASPREESDEQHR